MTELAPHVIGTRAIEVDCPTCKAVPFVSCAAMPTGYALAGYHRSRIAAATRVTKEANAKARRERTHQRTDGT